MGENSTISVHIGTENLWVLKAVLFPTYPQKGQVPESHMECLWLCPGSETGSKNFGNTVEEISLDAPLLC